MGCGKTTVGRLLAERLGYPFDDADDFHSPENRAKMSAGIPLRDEDRLDWLATLKERIERRRSRGENLVLACSALKSRYRDLLGVDQKEVISVYLEGTYQLLRERIDLRDHQYMNKGLLASQLDTMEKPEGGLIVNIDCSPEALCDEIVTRLGAFGGSAEIESSPE
jgi:carbohydrate kinase (thermoresistant glucokinase family)